MDLKISDKVALVTGASSGIGQAVAVALAQEGVKVALSGRRHEALDHTKALMQVADDRAFVVAGDLTIQENCTSVVEKTYEHFGDLHILVNCAAQIIPTGTLDITDELWEKLLSSMFFNVVWMCKAAVPRMKEQRWGRIVNVSSSAVKYPIGAVGYDVAKTSIVTYSRDLAGEVAEHNILVNSLCPGSTITPVWTAPGGTGEQIAKAMGTDVNTMLNSTAQTMMLKRVGRPEEIASVIAFLVSEQASFMTGSSVYVDGGQTRAAF